MPDCVLDELLQPRCELMPCHFLLQIGVINLMLMVTMQIPQHHQSCHPGANWDALSADSRPRGASSARGPTMCHGGRVGAKGVQPKHKQNPRPRPRGEAVAAATSTKCVTV